MLRTHIVPILYYCLTLLIRLLGVYDQIWEIQPWLKQAQRQDCYHGNDTMSVILCLLWYTFLITSSKWYCSKISRDILIQCCTVFVELLNCNYFLPHMYFKKGGLIKTLWLFLGELWWGLTGCCDERELTCSALKIFRILHIFHNYPAKSRGISSDT